MFMICEGESEFEMLGGLERGRRGQTRAGRYGMSRKGPQTSSAGLADCAHMGKMGLERCKIGRERKENEQYFLGILLGNYSAG